MTGEVEPFVFFDCTELEPRKCAYCDNVLPQTHYGLWVAEINDDGTVDETRPVCQDCEDRKKK